MRNVDQDFWDDSLLIKMYDEARETTYVSFAFCIIV